MEIPRHWRIQKQRYALAGETCPHCEGKIFPPRPVCPHCGNGFNAEAVQDQNKAYEVSGMLLAPAGIKTS